MISNTVLRGVESSRKQPKLNQDLVEYLDDVAPSNKTYTRGVVVYEMLMLEGQVESEDTIDELESRVDGELDDEVDGLSTLIDAVRVCDDDQPVLDLEQKSQTSIWLPNNIGDDLSYSYAQDIVSAIEYYSEVPWDDRQHRIDVKQDILSYVRAQEDDNRQVDVMELCELAQDVLLARDYLEGVDKIDDVLDNVEKEWYHNPDVDFAEMMERADEVKQTKDARIKFIKTFYQKKKQMAKNNAEQHDWDVEETVDYWMPDNEQEIEQDIEEMFNPSRPTLESYTDTIVKWWTDE